MAESKGPMSDADQVAADKESLRRQLLAGRRARSRPDRASARTAIAAHLWPHLLRCGVVCAYLPLATEPLAPSLLDRLTAAGVRVLVPMVAADAPLDWTDHPAPTTSGPFGIAEPAGPRLGPDAVTTADVVLVPALAVDREGHRLGRGGGHYDRSLALLAPAGPGAAGTKRNELIAVLFDGELLPSVPFDTHDIAVEAVVTPAAGLRGPAG